MYNLEFSSLFLVGTSEEKCYFEPYFKEVKLFEKNITILQYYNKDTFPIIFLNCNTKEKDVIEVCKEIRRNNQDIIIALLSDKLDANRLKEALPLRLSGCIEKPLQENMIKSILQNISRDLKFLNSDVIRFKNGYHFCCSQQILYNTFNKEIKLTKNEFKLLNILMRAKNELVSEESIEYEIWEEDSLDKDCNNRLKNLLYNLRKKLPKNSISNNYKLGYKLIYS